MTASSATALRSSSVKSPLPVKAALTSVLRIEISIFFSAGESMPAMSVAGPSLP